MTVAAAAASASTANDPLQTYLKNQAATQAAATASTASSDPTSASSIAGNFNTFISILTTQLKNQDPTAATDTNQFTQELVQFAQVEQQLNTNSDLNKIYNNQTASSLATGAGYIGGYVESATTDKSFTVQNGASEFGYTLASNANNVQIAITDSKGNAVASFDGSGSAGANYLSWNGQTGSGKQYADGTYTFTVTATDSNGAAVAVTNPVTFAKVTSVATSSDGTLQLTTGSTAVSSSNVTGIFSAATLPTANPLVRTPAATSGTSS